MSLSKAELRVWNELERALADDLPQTDVVDIKGEHWAPAISSSTPRLLWLSMALIAGVTALIGGAFAYQLPLALTGFVIACIAAHCLTRTGSNHNHWTRTTTDTPARSVPCLQHLARLPIHGSFAWRNAPQAQP